MRRSTALARAKLAFTPLGSYSHMLFEGVSLSQVGCPPLVNNEGNDTHVAKALTSLQYTWGFTSHKVVGQAASASPRPFRILLHSACMHEYPTLPRLRIRRSCGVHPRLRSSRRYVAVAKLNPRGGDPTAIRWCGHSKPSERSELYTRNRFDDLLIRPRGVRLARSIVSMWLYQEPSGAINCAC
jgi:hypothetical protein